MTPDLTAASSQPLWMTLGLAVLGTSALAAIITAVVGNLRTAAGQRREGYAKASKVLLRRVEFAYRIRRRVSDEPEVLQALAALGSDIQEELAWCRAWIRTENRTVARVFEEVCQAIDAEVADWTSDAWQLPPITEAESMNLGQWGPRNHNKHIARLQEAASWRFGISRAVPARPRLWWWRRRARAVGHG
jgi:hypothetical protein